MPGGRATVRVRKGMVASSHELASYYGTKILSQGGNVVDAAITTSAMLCVTQNNMCGLGGDMFALLKIGGGKVLNLNGSGRASRNSTIEFYREEKKLGAIPDHGPLACPTVPGLVHAWGELYKKFATIELDKLLSPAIEYARNGFPVTTNYTDSIVASARALGRYGEWSKIFLPNGSAPEPGTLLKQEDLGVTLQQIAEGGASTFYEGGLADKITSGIRDQGGLIDEYDLRSHSSTWTDPLKTNYRGLDIYETAPNSQAATVILWLNMLQEYDLGRDYQINSPELLEIMIDTCLRSLEERAKAIADPEFHRLDSEFTTREYARKILRAPSNRSNRSTKTPAHSGDTTYFTVGDSEGDCLSVIQSNYMGFGSGLVPRGTGFVLHNRGCYFSLDPTHHNSLGPGKRTFHTLCASLGEKETRETAFTIGSMGGDVQPQIHVQLMTKVIDYGMDPQIAIDSPRWIIPATIYEEPSVIYFEPGIEVSSNRFKSFAAERGLAISRFDAPSSLTGHAQAITWAAGSLAGGADPRGDGAVVGF